MKKVIKMSNISNVQVPVVLEDGTTVYLPPRESIENVTVKNYESIAKFIRADISLNEPREAKVSGGKGKRSYLKG